MEENKYNYIEEIKRRKAEQKEYAKDYYRINKKKILAKQKLYKEKNTEKIKEHQKKYIDKNREKINKYHKNYYRMKKIRRQKKMTHAKMIINNIRERFEDLDEYIELYEDSQKELEEKKFFLRELKKIVKEEEAKNGNK